MAGIDDVARAAGVSTATVSRALRGLPNVNLATRERVRAAATSLGYVPSPSAASLASGRTRTIGLLSPCVNRWYVSNVMEGAGRVLRGHGFDALLHTVRGSGDLSRERLDAAVLGRRVDGILVVDLPLDEGETASLVGLGRPVVTVGRIVGCDGCRVTVRLDDEAAGASATQHLLDLGHRRIGHVTGVPEAGLRSSPLEDRHVGWRRALAAAGVPDDPRGVASGALDVAGGRATTRALLERLPDTTAVFAASDELAMGAILAARDVGRRVPTDLSVVGVDGHELGELVGLTTMVQPALAQGLRAAEVLLDQMSGVDTPDDVVFSAELLVRTSTGPAP